MQIFRDKIIAYLTYEKIYIESFLSIKVTLEY